MIPLFSQKLVNSLLSNCVLFSEIIFRGIPYQQTMFLMTKSRDFFAVMLASVSASAYFVK